MTKRNIRGTLILLFTAFIWGTAFVAQSTAADSIGSFTFNAARSVIATLFLGALILGRKVFFAAKGRKRETTPAGRKRTLIGGTVCGVLLFIACNFQQFGIAAYPADAAASGRAGFLTATYVVMIALFSWIKSRKLNVTMALATVGCIVGMYLLCLSGGISKIYAGDGLVLLCALGYTFYIIAIDSYSSEDGLVLSFIQFAVSALLSTAATLIFEHPQISSFESAWFEILYLGIFSSGIGYTLQIVGQKYAEPTSASIAMSMESVFAALAGWIILSEKLSAVEIVGCVLMFASVVLSQLPEPKFLHRKKSAK